MISDTELKQITNLAKLIIDENTKHETIKDLNAILELATQLGQIDTNNITPMAHPLHMTHMPIILLFISCIFANIGCNTLILVLIWLISLEISSRMSVLQPMLANMQEMNNNMIGMQKSMLWMQKDISQLRSSFSKPMRVGVMLVVSI
jgi:hypothetical protein